MKKHSSRPRSKHESKSRSIHTVDIESGGLAQGWVDFFHTLVDLLESDFESVLVSIKHVFSDSNYVLVRSVSQLPHDEDRQKIFRALLDFLLACSRHTRHREILSYYHHFTELVMYAGVGNRNLFDQYLKHILSYQHLFMFYQMEQVHQYMIRHLSNPYTSILPHDYARFFVYWAQRAPIKEPMMLRLLKSMRRERQYSTFKHIHMNMLTCIFDTISQSQPFENALSKYSMLLACSSELGLFHKELPNKRCTEFHLNMRDYFQSLSSFDTKAEKMQVNVVKLSDLICSYMTLVIDQLLKDRRPQNDRGFSSDSYMKTCCVVAARLKVLALTLGNDEDIGHRLLAFLVALHDHATPSRQEITHRWNYSVLLHETGNLFNNAQSDWLRERVRSVWGCLYAQLIRGALSALIAGAHDDQSIARFHLYDEFRDQLLSKYGNYLLISDQWQHYFEDQIESRIPVIKEQLVALIRDSESSIHRQRVLALLATFMHKIIGDMTRLSGVVQPFVLQLRFRQFYNFYQHSIAPFIQFRSQPMFSLDIAEEITPSLTLLDTAPAIAHHDEFLEPLHKLPAGQNYASYLSIFSDQSVASAHQDPMLAEQENKASPTPVQNFSMR